MKKRLVLSPRFKGGLVRVVLVDDIAVAFCHYYSDAIEIARAYRNDSSRHSVVIVEACVNMGEVFGECILDSHFNKN